MLRHTTLCRTRGRWRCQRRLCVAERDPEYQRDAEHDREEKQRPFRQRSGHPACAGCDDLSKPRWNELSEAHVDVRTRAKAEVPAILRSYDEAKAEAHEARTAGRPRRAGPVGHAEAPAPAQSPAHPLHRVRQTPRSRGFRGPCDRDDDHLRPRLDLPVMREVHAEVDRAGEGTRRDQPAGQDGGSLALTSLRRSTIS